MADSFQVEEKYPYTATLLVEQLCMQAVNQARSTHNMNHLLAEWVGKGLCHKNRKHNNPLSLV